jgi:hypothetical protein
MRWTGFPVPTTVAAMNQTGVKLLQPLSAQAQGGNFAKNHVGQLIPCKTAFNPESR